MLFVNPSSENRTVGCIIAAIDKERPDGSVWDEDCIVITLQINWILAEGFDSSGAAHVKCGSWCTDILVILGMQNASQEEEQKDTERFHGLKDLQYYLQL